jgi:hypothetical protein
MHSSWHGIVVVVMAARNWFQLPRETQLPREKLWYGNRIQVERASVKQSRPCADAAIIRIIMMNQRGGAALIIVKQTLSLQCVMLNSVRAHFFDSAQHDFKIIKLIERRLSHETYGL